MKFCSQCKQPGEFYRDSRRENQFGSWCKACMCKNSRKYKLKRKYKITQEEYNALFLKQNGQCAICAKYQADERRSLCIDHNHTTGVVRGLLCENCNRGLGLFRDNTESLENAKIYLNRSNLTLVEESKNA